MNPTAPLAAGRLRQALLGLVALPLSVVPFLAYGTFTPEGRLVRDRIRVMVSPPRLPELTAAEQEAAAAAAPRYQGRVMNLVYHGVGSGSDGEGGFVVSPERFGEHLATLRAAGMQAVTASEVAEAFGGGTPLPDHAVMISFDDGRNDAFMWSDPLLEQAGMAATMFVITTAASRPGVYYAGWDRLEAAARSGRWDIQAHTDDSHREQKATGGGSLPRLTSLAPGESLEEYRRRVADDLDRNRSAIEAHTGRLPVAFAYPFGAYGAERTNDPGIRPILAEEVAARFALAFHQDDQDTVPLADPSHDRIGLRRLEVGNWTGLELLQRIGAAAGDEAPAARPAQPPVDEVAAAKPEPGTVHLPSVPAAPPPAPEAPPAVAAASALTNATVSPPEAEPPAATTTTAEPPTTTRTAKPPTTTTTAEPPTTTTTAKPPTTTTTARPPVTTTTVCQRVNGKPCTKG